MAPSICAFAAPMALVNPRQTVAASSRCQAVRMSVSEGEPKKMSLMDWINSKIMPGQADWEEAYSEKYVLDLASGCFVCSFALSVHELTKHFFFPFAGHLYIAVT